MSPTIVTIDGPSASGKSTVASRVAAQLGFVYVDSGSLYRGITWKVLRDGLTADDDDAVVAMLDSIAPDFFLRQRAVVFTIDGLDPGADLRGPTVREQVSPLSAIPQVRGRVVAWLHDMPRFGDLVVEGRDIGSLVFPDAVHKFYLDASPEERARRRQRDLTARNEQASLESVRAGLEQRDKRDTSRPVAPLVVPAGATIIDTTRLDIDAVVCFIVAAVTGTGKQ